MKKTGLIIGFCCICVGSTWYMAVNQNAKEKVYGVVKSVSVDELVFKDEMQIEYIIQTTDFDFKKKQLKIKDRVVVKFEGEILEASPAKFKKVLDIKKDEQ